MTNSLNKILTGALRKEQMVDFLKKNPTLFDETINISLGDYQPESWRAAWLIKHYMNKNDKRITKYINAILKVLVNKKDGHQRELLKILLAMELTEKQEGILFDKCITIWEDINKSPSVRSFAFLILTNTVKKYPELMVEIGFLTQNHYTESLSPGIRHSIVRVINKLHINI
ncbi:MAG: hypothetical protein KKF62_07900 [Bacteroidetes bacterium]|nr:hypothetical protein [Bacteroidota bacterium]MBU1115930.1 hypothetical protein [Bacteroidota bacterium]MBU1798473.1 hypothetical protein [Bacteroidota bacterium]